MEILKSLVVAVLLSSVFLLFFFFIIKNFLVRTELLKRVKNNLIRAYSNFKSNTDLRLKIAKKFFILSIISGVSAGLVADIMSVFLLTSGIICIISFSLFLSFGWNRKKLV